jgi:nucleoside 2-deoxyribosyltransferase
LVGAKQRGFGPINKGINMETILKSPYIYIAGPFFNPEQLAIIEDIKKVLQFSGLEYFSPKDECMYEPGVTTPEQVLDINVRALEQTDLTICVTDGRDPGTMFEAGWCYAKSVPIIYVWLGGTPEQKFNLVLAASGSVVRSYTQLDTALREIQETGTFIRKNWSEESIQYE